MVQCEHFDFLPDFYMKKLDEDLTNEVTAHLQECEDCNAFLLGLCCLDKEMAKTDVSVRETPILKESERVQIERSVLL